MPKPAAETFLMVKGRYHVRRAVSAQDIYAAQGLRAMCFGRDRLIDSDPFDGPSQHVLVEESDSHRLVCCFRLLPVAGHDLGQSYAAQFYDLSKLAQYPGLMMEMGRFCVHPAWRDPDILRIAWAAVTDEVDQRGVEMLFGCSSFEGIDVARYADAFDMLKAQYLAPACWRPGEKAEDVYHYTQATLGVGDRRQALRSMPSLLRTYLLMGGWVSDHAVIDPQMNTLHVFTGLEIAAIPDGRKRLLRALI